MEYNGGVTGWGLLAWRHRSSGRLSLRRRGSRYHRSGPCSAVRQPGSAAGTRADAIPLPQPPTSKRLNGSGARSAKKRSRTIRQAHAQAKRRRCRSAKTNTHHRNHHPTAVGRLFQRRHRPLPEETAKTHNQTLAAIILVMVGHVHPSKPILLGQESRSTTAG